jgi:hypothetical protein
MRYALIDHSTLTACQRLLGAIPVTNLHAIDGDICALESYVKAVLFYDTVFYIDDYKVEHRDERERFFPELAKIPSSSALYEEAVKKAKKFAADIALRIESGEIRDDFREFFRLLQMNCVFEWNMYSSEFFLVIKMLGDMGGVDVKKFSKLQEMIFGELGSKYSNTLHDAGRNTTLVGSDGEPLPFSPTLGDRSDRVSRQLKAFIACLNWLSLRTALYLYIASNYRIDSMLHPIRHSFQYRYGERVCGMGVAVFQPIISSISGTIKDTVDSIKEATDPVIARQDLPIFSAWLVSKTKDSAKVIEAALDLKERPDIAKARKQLIDLEDIQALRDHKTFVREANKLVRSVLEHSKLLKTKYGIDCGQGIPTAPLVTVANSVLKAIGSVEMPRIDVKLPIPDVIIKCLSRPGFKAVFANVVDDLSNVAKLGALHAILTSRVQRHPDFHEKDANLTPKHFRYAKPHWKRPM